MAYSRREIIRNIDIRANDILDHLIKILYFKDDLNYNKHINDIDNKWLGKIKKRNLKSGKYLKPETYYDWLFYKLIEEKPEYLNESINDLLRYNKLETLITKDELMEKLINIYKKISADLSIGNFTTIRKYL